MEKWAARCWFKVRHSRLDQLVDIVLYRQQSVTGQPSESGVDNGYLSPLHLKLPRFRGQSEIVMQRGRFGSGESESAHCFSPQERLKIAGACWREETLNLMLAPWVIRAIGWWNDFWKSEVERRAG